uniref:Uncharacterized protein n=1 Tax=Oryza glumipatula TaxID=40148 RepID=A0A0D9Y2Z2_9ORYZ
MAADSCLAAVAAGGGLSRRRTPSRFWWLSSRLLLGLHALEGVLLHQDGGRRPVGFILSIRRLRLFSATLLPSSRESGHRISAALAQIDLADETNTDSRGCEGSRTTAVSSRDKKGRMKVIGLAADDPRCSTATDEFKENMYYEQVGEY